MRSLVTVLCGALLTLPSVSLAQHEQHEQHHSSAKEAVHKGSEAWAAGWNAGDAAAIAALYAEDAVLMAPGAEPAEGRAAIMEALKSSLAASSGSQQTIKVVEVMEAEGWAVETGTFVVTAADGTHEDHGRYMAVWKNVGGKWMIVRDIWNSSM